MAYFDSINRGQRAKEVLVEKKENKTLFYFYKSLRIIFYLWVLVISVIIFFPWANYWVKSLINKEVNEKVGQILGENTVDTTKKVSTLVPENLESRFVLKNENVDINAPIVEGVEEENLSQGIGHHQESVWPNQKGNVVLAGHNFDLDAEDPYGKVFFDLRDVNIDDEVTIYYKGQIYRYIIFKKETVSPEDTSLFAPVEDWMLTFYTCDPPYTDWKRLVFQAKLLKIE